MGDIGDAVEGGHLRVGGEDPQVIPPLSSGCVPLKGERRMVPLRIPSREVLVQGNHIHAQAAVDEVNGGVDGANPRFQLARPVHRHDPQEGVNRFGGGDKVDDPQLGEGQLQLLPQVCAPPLLRSAPARSGSRMSIWNGGGEGSKPFAHSTTSPTSRPPVHVASCGVCGRQGRAKKWAWVSAAGSGRLPCCERAIAREIRAA